MKLTRRSILTNAVNTLDINVTQEQLDRWMRGELIQNVMGNLTAEEREFIKTGITSAEWDHYFSHPAGDTE